MNFGGNNNGQVAHVIINVQVSGDDSEQLVQFSKSLGVSCCGDSMRFYKRVLASGQFSHDELRRAISQGSIRWEPGASRPKIVTPWTEPVFVVLFFGMMGLYALIALLSILMNWADLANLAVRNAFGLVVICTLLMMMAEKWILRPRNVALRVKRWMHMKGLV